jgi:WD40 repeat protein
VTVYNPLERSEIEHLEPSGGVLSLAYSPGNSLLAAGSQLGNEAEGYDGKVDIWYVPNWEPWRIISDSGRAVTSVDFSRDGMLFMAAFTNPDENDNSVAIWDTSAWVITQTLKTGSVSEIAFSPNGKLVGATPDRYAINIWQTRTGFLQRSIPTSFTGAVSQIAFSPDGKTIAAGSYDGSVRIWGLDTGALLLEMNTGSVVDSLAFSPDGKMLASGGGYQNTAIQVWDTTNGVLLRKLEGHPSSVVSLAFSPDNQLLASGSYDGTLRLWGLRP